MPKSIMISRKLLTGNDRANRELLSSIMDIQSGKTPGKSGLLVWLIESPDFELRLIRKIL